MRPLTPANIAAPLARYAHGVLLPAGARIVRTSGQLGLAADSTVPENVADQGAICFGNIRTILAEGGMGDRGHLPHLCLVDRSGRFARLHGRAGRLSRRIRRAAGINPLLVAGFS
jgi:enamine deaminase RidA (YjgF/YER057c/UK114 family)